MKVSELSCASGLDLESGMKLSRTNYNWQARRVFVVDGTSKILSEITE